MLNKANDFLWNVLLIVLLCGTGIYFTIRLKFIQVRKFREGWHLVFGSMGHKHERKEGEMTPFQSHGNCHCGTGRNRKSGRCGNCTSGRRTGCHFLDVAVGIFRHGYHLCGGDTGPEV